MTALPDRGPRWPLALLSVLHAGVFGAAAMVLPWRAATTFAVLAAGLALLHLAVAGLALLGGGKRLRTVWRVNAVVSLAFLGWAAWTVGSSALYLAEIYGAIGAGVGGALLALLSPAALVTLPYACWGLAATGGVRFGATRASAVTGLALVGLLGVAWAMAPTSQAVDTPSPAEAPANLSGFDELPDSAHPPGLGDAGPAVCEHAVDEAGERATAIVAFTAHDGTAQARCLQAAPEAIWGDVERLLRLEGTRNPAAVDLLLATRPLDGAPPGLAGLALRPGYDGVCAFRSCLAPWQLLGRDAFVSETPLAWIPDMRIGTREEVLRAALGEMSGPLTAFESAQFVLTTTGEWRRFVRLRPEAEPLTPEAIDAAMALAEDHVVAAQTSTGVFRYKLTPMTGRGTSAGWGLPRQAGTTLTLCEQGRATQAVADTISRSLATMAQRERTFGTHSVLTESKRATRASLGGSALPLIAFLMCREREGERHDALIGRLLKTVLTLQRPNGGFRPGIDRATGAALPGSEPLYASGQAVMALLLAEGLATRAATAPAGWPDVVDLRAAAERAMHYYGSEYWDFAMKDFFYIEENWHCLAARVALGHHRHEAYEQFCLDYTDFKGRTMLDESSDVDPTFVGGHGFGNIIAPHNTPTGGYGEIAAAAIAIREARGEDTTADKAMLAATLRFLITQQWSEDACFSCARGAALGAWSESISSTMVRIDFVQHAWSALGHGREVLFAERGADG